MVSAEKRGEYSKARYKAWDKANKKRAAANRKITHGIVYKLTSPSGKSYVGISKYTIERRILWHKSQQSCCKAIKAALKKYGFNAFKKEVLHSNIPLDELPSIEQREIAAHDTMAPKGYNLTRGGEYNPMDEPATRKKISIAKTEYWKSRGGGSEAAKWMQSGDARERATATKLARSMERWQAQASKLPEAKREAFIKSKLAMRAYRQRLYQETGK
jgi:group I intron endonuclease